MTTPVKQWRGVHLVGALNGDVRLETFRGVEHVVSPVVMLIGDTVIHPFNADEPEFIPAEVLAVAPAGWNGRPIMAGDHPNDESGMLSANIPSVLESMGFGQIFHAEFTDNRLRGELWFDTLRARSIGEVAERILERVREHEQVEISVGAFVVHEARQGEHEGRRYAAAWQEVTPDHIAALREGLTGACSVSMGCGTPRVSARHLVAASGLHVLSPATLTDLRGGYHSVRYQNGHWEVLSEDGKAVLSRHETKVSAIAWKRERRLLVRAEEEADVATENRSLIEKTFDKVLGALSIRAAKSPSEMGDDERRSLVGEALKRADTQYVGVVTMTGLAEGEVVYWTDPDPGGPAPLRPYRRTYTLSDDGRVTLGDERVPVRPSTEWVPVTMKGKKQPEGQQAEEPTAASDGCGCGGQKASHGAETGAEGGAMAGAKHRNAERIKALIENDKTPFTAADQAYLEGLTDERFKVFEESAKPAPAAETTTQQTETPAPTAPAAAAAETTTAAATPAATTTAAAAPTAATAKSTVEIEAGELQTLRSMAAKQQATEAAQKRALVTKLKDAQQVYSEQQLLGMDVQRLEEVSRLLSINPAEVDYSLAAVPRGSSNVAEPPRPYDLAVARRRGSAA